MRTTLRLGAAVAVVGWTLAAGPARGAEPARLLAPLPAEAGSKMAPAVYPSYNLVTIVYLWPPTLVYAEPNSVQQGAPCWPSPVSAGTLIYGKIVMNGQYAVCRLP